MIRTMTAAALALTLLAAGAAAAAADAAKAPRFDDLDLSRPRDAQAYSGRVARAAEAACERQSTGFGSGQEMFECRNRMRAALVAAMPAAARTTYTAALDGRTQASHDGAAG